MNQEINPKDPFSSQGKPPLPSSLNVLTILTIIWSIISLVQAVYGYFTASAKLKETREMLESGKMQEMPEWARKMMPSAEMMQKMVDNKIPLLILGLVSAGLCLYGAIEMRKLKKQGYTFWLIGELLPFGTVILFIGMEAFAGFAAIFWCIPLVFILLYTINRKHLVY